MRRIIQIMNWDGLIHQQFLDIVKFVGELFSVIHAVPPEQVFGTLQLTKLLIELVKEIVLSFES